MKALKLFALILTIHLGLCSTSVQAAKKLVRQPSSPQSEQRNKVVAAALAAGVGFGAGHWYANSKWTMRSTTFVLVDAAAWTILVGGLRLSAPERSGDVPLYALWPVVVFIAAKAWQTVDAMDQVNRFNSSSDNQRSLNNIKPKSTAGVTVSLLSVRF